MAVVVLNKIANEILSKWFKEKFKFIWTSPVLILHCNIVIFTHGASDLSAKVRAA